MKKAKIYLFSLLFLAIFFSLKLSIFPVAEVSAATISATIDSYYPNDSNNPAVVEVGNSITIKVAFTNTGNTAWQFIAGASVWDFNGNIVADYERTNVYLQPGQQTTVSWTHTVSQAGNYWLQFGIWKDKPYIFENLLDKKPSPSQKLIISPTPLPDLVVSNIWTKPHPPEAAGFTNIYIEIKNQGASDAMETFFLEFYFDETYIGHVYIDGLPAGTTNTSNWRAITWPSDTNLHKIRGVVDPEKTIAESDENNNEHSILIRATELPAGIGTLKIESEPDDAKVYLDGGYKGNTLLSGYLTISDLTAGDHTLKVTKSGYKDWTGTVTIPSGGTQYKAVVLEAIVTNPSPPTPISPGSTSEPGPVIDTLTPTLQWESSADADYYALAISVYPYGSENIVYNPQKLYGNSVTVPSNELEPWKKYRWNMQAHNSVGWSDVSRTLYFQTTVREIIPLIYSDEITHTGLISSDYSNLHCFGGSCIADLTVKNENKDFWLELRYKGAELKSVKSVAKKIQQKLFKEMRLIPPQGEVIYTVEFNHDREKFYVRASFVGEGIFAHAVAASLLKVIGPALKMLGLPVDIEKPEELILFYEKYKDDESFKLSVNYFQSGINYLNSGKELKASGCFLQSTYYFSGLLWKIFRQELLKKPWKLLSAPFKMMYNAISFLGNDIVYLIQTRGLTNTPTVIFEIRNVSMPPETKDLPPDTFIASVNIENNMSTFACWKGRDDLTPESELSYSYYLEGYDASWSNWSSITSTNYFDLTQGEYIFKVKARDKVGNVDPTPAEYFFTTPLRLSAQSLLRKNGTIRTPYQRYALSSPGELRVYDSQGRLTGLINGEIREEIPSSAYDEESKSIVIFPVVDDCNCQIVGTDEGTYGLEITSVENGKATTFNATDIPAVSGAIHNYIVDWDALSEGEKGVTVKVDSDDDGVYERKVTSDSELTGDEFSSGGGGGGGCTISNTHSFSIGFLLLFTIPFILFVIRRVKRL